MSASRKLSTGIAALAALCLATAGLAATANATKTVKIPSKVTLSVYGYKGKVSSPRRACVTERTVVLKQKGHGVLGRAKSKSSGGWEVSPEDLKFKGRLPYLVYAEVKPRSEGTAGTIYKCLGATSKTLKIAGG